MNLKSTILLTLTLFCLTETCSAQGKSVIGIINEHGSNEYRIEQILDFILENKTKVTCLKSQEKKLSKKDSELYNQIGIKPIAMIIHHQTKQVECIDLISESMPIELILNNNSAILGVYYNKLYYTNPEIRVDSAITAHNERKSIAIMPLQG